MSESSFQSSGIGLAPLKISTISTRFLRGKLFSSCTVEIPLSCCFSLKKSTDSSINIGSCGILYSTNSSGSTSITVAILSNVMPLVENGIALSIRLYT